MADINNYSDIELIHRLFNEKDNKWFGHIYDRHASMVYNKCRSMLNNADDAKDLTHEIFIKAFVKLGQFKGNSLFKTWLLSIANNSCIDFLKKTRQYIEVSLDEEVIDIASEKDYDKIILEMDITSLEVILNEIPTNDKMILLMKYQDGLSIKEIEQILNINKSAVKMRIKRAKTKLINQYSLTNME